MQVRIRLGHLRGLHLPPTPLQPPLGVGATRDRGASLAMGSRVRGDSSSKALGVLRCIRCSTAPAMHQSRQSRLAMGACFSRSHTVIQLCHCRHSLYDTHRIFSHSSVCQMPYGHMSDEPLLQCPQSRLHLFVSFCLHRASHAFLKSHLLLCILD